MQAAVAPRKLTIQVADCLHPGPAPGCHVDPATALVDFSRSLSACSRAIGTSRSARTRGSAERYRRCP
jgi:hypothetical protein